MLWAICWRYLVSVSGYTAFHWIIRKKKSSLVLLLNRAICLNMSNRAVQGKSSLMDVYKHPQPSLDSMEIMPYKFKKKSYLDIIESIQFLKLGTQFGSGYFTWAVHVLLLLLHVFLAIFSRKIRDESQDLPALDLPFAKKPLGQRTCC